MNPFAFTFPIKTQPSISCCWCVLDTPLITRRGRGMLMVFKMERGVHWYPLTVAIETLYVKYKAKKRPNYIGRSLKPHGSLTCCVYVRGSLVPTKRALLAVM